MFTPGRLYKHKKNREVALFVIERRATLQGWRLLVGWWNIGHCHLPWPISGTRQVLLVPTEEAFSWEAINEGYRVGEAEYRPVFY